MTWPIAYRWTGKVMEPLPRLAKRCAETFKVDEIYTLDEVKERSSNSHRHFFAVVREAWLNLPEEIAEQFPTDTHLRKFALVRTGHCDIKKIAAETPQDAKTIAAVVQKYDAFAVVTVADKIVTVATAKSQSYRAMDKQEFAASKADVLEYVAGMARTTTAQLAENAKVSA